MDSDKNITQEEYRLIFKTIDNINARGEYDFTPVTPEMSLVILSEVFSELDEKTEEHKIIPVLNDFYKLQKRDFSFLLTYPSSTWEKVFNLCRDKRLGTFNTHAWLTEKNTIDKKLL